MNRCDWFALGYRVAISENYADSYIISARENALKQGVESLEAFNRGYYWGTK